MRKLLSKDKDGQSVVEFALVLPILLLVLFGITEFGRAIMVTNILNTASREGARLAAVSPVGDPKVLDRVLEVLNAANIEATVDSTSYDPDQKTVTVTVRYHFKFLSGRILDFLYPSDDHKWLDLKGTTVMMYEG